MRLQQKPAKPVLHPNTSPWNTGKYKNVSSSTALLTCVMSTRTDNTLINAADRFLYKPI